MSASTSRSERSTQSTLASGLTSRGGVTKCWDDDEWTRGASAYYKPGRFSSLLPHVARPEGEFIVHLHAYAAADWKGPRPNPVTGKPGPATAEEHMRQTLAAMDRYKRREGDRQCAARGR